MKRLISIFLTLFLLTPAETALAEEMNVTSLSGLGDIPSDAFSGTGREFTGEDGAVTVVYDNGSMKTSYQDGTYEGIDYNGNLYKSGENGEVSISCLDGSTAMQYSNDTLRRDYPDGTYEIKNPDGSVEKNSNGFVTKQDAEGNLLSIGFENGEKIEMDDGVFPEGDHTVTGPNGETLSIHYDPNKEDTELSIHLEAGGTTFDLTAKDGAVDMHQSEADGRTVDCRVTDDSTEMHIREAGGDSMDMIADEKTGEFHMTAITDGKEGTVDVTVKEDGSGTLRIKNNETDITISAGDDGSMDMRDNSTGAYARYGQDGIDIKNADGTGIRIDAEGNIISADLRDENGNQILAVKDGVTKIMNPENPSETLSLTREKDGSVLVVNPRGDTYQIEPDGTIYKNGEPLTPSQHVETSQHDTEEVINDPAEGSAGYDYDALCGTSGLDVTWFNGTWDSNGKLQEIYIKDSHSLVMGSNEGEYSFDPETGVITLPKIVKTAELGTFTTPERKLVANAEKDELYMAVKGFESRGLMTAKRVR
jgi:hypothetical protein